MIRAQTGAVANIKCTKPMTTGRNIIHQISVPAILAFYMDNYLVTNQEYRTFLESSGYHPSDMTNFLHDWDWSDSAHPRPMRGFEDHPAVWVDLHDARAYASWAGKRLPTEEEWQYAAGGAKMLRYPWGNTWDSERANDRGTSTSSVTAFSKGINQFGLSDMSGNVWEWTESGLGRPSCRLPIVDRAELIDFSAV